jgi:hypothetical protein
MDYPPSLVSETIQAPPPSPVVNQELPVPPAAPTMTASTAVSLSTSPADIISPAAEAAASAAQESTSSTNAVITHAANANVAAVLQLKDASQLIANAVNFVPTAAPAASFAEPSVAPSASFAEPAVATPSLPAAASAASSIPNNTQLTPNVAAGIVSAITGTTGPTDQQALAVFHAAEDDVEVRIRVRVLETHMKRVKAYIVTHSQKLAQRTDLLNKLDQTIQSTQGPRGQLRRYLAMKKRLIDQIYRENGYLQQAEYQLTEAEQVLKILHQQEANADTRLEKLLQVALGSTIAQLPQGTTYEVAQKIVFAFRNAVNHYRSARAASHAQGYTRRGTAAARLLAATSINPTDPLLHQRLVQFVPDANTRYFTASGTRSHSRQQRFPVANSPTAHCTVTFPPLDGRPQSMVEVDMQLVGRKSRKSSRKSSKKSKSSHKSSKKRARNSYKGGSRISSMSHLP